MNEHKPGRTLDALIAEKVMGWVRRGSAYPELVPPDYSFPNLASVEHINTPQGQVGVPVLNDGLPHYSTDIAAAWEVVEKLGKCCFEVGRTEPDGKQVYCNFAFYDEAKRQYINHLAKADTAPHAICLAALKAVGNE